MIFQKVKLEVEIAPTLVDNSGIDDSLTIIESLGVTIEKKMFWDLVFH